MVRVISQETFDAVVKENMEMFEMTKDDALKEAKEQFETQGVNLANIVMALEEDSDVFKAVAGVRKMEEDGGDLEGIAGLLDQISSECRKGLAEKAVCTKNDGYRLLLRIASPDHPNSSPGVRASAVGALASLLDRNCDVLDSDGFVVLVRGLEAVEEPKVVEASLDMALSGCVLHEANRQNLVRNGVLDRLDGVVDSHPIRVAKVWRALVQDDDVRVPHGKAHEHARDIVEKHGALSKLSALVQRNLENDDNLRMLLSCTSSLSVRSEYCQSVAENDGLKNLLDILIDPDRAKPVLAEALTLLKTLAGNDNVKREIGTSQGLCVVVHCMMRCMSSGPVCLAGCQALAAVCLRTPENSRQIMEAGGANLITQIMKTHSKSRSISIACCDAIRNIVSRSKQHHQEFVSLDVETLLNEVLENHPRDSEANAKAALRDLDLKVHLKEAWTGSSKSTVENTSETGMKGVPEELEE